MQDKTFNAPLHRVAVTGMGIITALGVGTEENLSGIVEGRNAIQEITSFDAGSYRSRTGGEIPTFQFSKQPQNLRSSRLDRSTQFLLTALDEAIEQAGLPQGLPADTQVILGTTLGGMLSGQRYHQQIVSGKKGTPSLLLDYFAHLQGIHIAREYGLDGQTKVISNACASGTNAIGCAFQEIRNNHASTVIAGGYDTMCEFTFAGFHSLQAVTPTLCRPFDKNRNGLALGEGVGVLILEEWNHAAQRKANILAEIIGYGESSDAFHMTRPAPSGESAALAISRALDAAHLAPGEIDYINAHGTATPFNDVMEAKAIQTVFKSASRNIPVSSVKSMIGHLLGGAGAVEAIMTVLSINEGVLLPNINFTTPDPECSLSIVDRPGQKGSIRRAVSNSFGFGGANAALVIQGASA